MKTTKTDIVWKSFHFVWIGMIALVGMWDIVAFLYTLLDWTIGSIALASLQSLWRAFLWIICWYAGFYTLITLNLYLATRRVYGRITPEIRKTMLKLTDISQAYQVVRGGRALIILTGLSGVIAVYTFSEWRLIFVPGLAAVILVWLWIRVSTPPCLVFLGTSTQRGLNLHHSFKRSIAPVRVVSLLALEVAEHEPTKSELHLDCLRTNVDHEWCSVIKVLLDTAPLIAMDSSVVTPAIDCEIQYILTSDKDLTRKCIFFSSSFPELPALDKYVSYVNEHNFKLCCVAYNVAHTTVLHSLKKINLRSASK